MGNRFRTLRDRVDHEEHRRRQQERCAAEGHVEQINVKNPAWGIVSDVTCARCYTQLRRFTREESARLWADKRAQEADHGA